MKASIVWPVVVCLTMALVTLVNYLKGYFTLPPSGHLALMLGQAVGFNLIPIAVGGGVYLFRKTLKSFFISWLVTFVIFGIGASYQASLDTVPAKLNLPEVTSSFAAPFAPWRVTFIGNPTVSQMQHGVRGEPAIQAEREYSNESLCRVEIYKVPPDMPYNAAAAENMLRRVAQRDGLSDLALLSENTPLGFKHTLRGGKVLHGKTGQYRVTYSFQVYYTNGSFIVMTVGAPASSYPTREIMYFLNSVTKI